MKYENDLDLHNKYVVAIMDLCSKTDGIYP